MFWTQLTDEVTAKFLYLEIKNIDFSAQDTGTSIPSNSTKQLNCIEIKIPPAEALNALDKMLLPLFELRKTNLKEISEIDFFRQMILSELGS